jgi:hypothetical protein
LKSHEVQVDVPPLAARRRLPSITVLSTSPFAINDFNPTWNPGFREGLSPHGEVVLREENPAGSKKTGVKT